MHTLTITWRGAQKWQGGPGLFLEFFLANYNDTLEEMFHHINYITSLGVEIKQEVSPDPDVSWITLITADTEDSLYHVKNYYQTMIEGRLPVLKDNIKLEYQIV